MKIMNIRNIRNIMIPMNITNIMNIMNNMNNMNIMNSFNIMIVMIIIKSKSRIRETKHLLTNADSSTNTTVGWTKNSQKPIFFEKQKKSSKTQKL